MLAPDLGAELVVRRGERHMVTDASCERTVHVVADHVVAGHDDEAVEAFDGAEERGGLLIVVAFNARIDISFAAAGEEAFAFIEHDGGFFGLRFFEQLCNVPGAFSDELADEVVRTDVQQIQTEFMADRLRGHGLAGAARSVEQRDGGFAVGHDLLESEIIEDLGFVAELEDDVVDRLLLFVIEDDVFELGRWHDTLGQTFELAGALSLGRIQDEFFGL